MLDKKFLKNKTILVTGGTGSFGTVFIEKILKEQYFITFKSCWGNPGGNILLLLSGVFAAPDKQ